MTKRSNYFLVLTVIALLASPAATLRAAISGPDQTALKQQYVGKVLIFRKDYRMARRLDVAEDGTVTGVKVPGFWSVDGALQINDLSFDKKSVTFKGSKLWANIKNDGQLHYFLASVALKDKPGYALLEEVVFHTSVEKVSADQFRASVDRIFLDGNDSQLSSTPQPISAYIQNVTPQYDVDTASPKSWGGTLPKVISGATPLPCAEAKMAGQAGEESFVVYIDEKGNAAVTGFTKLLQYGLEETTIEAVKAWKFEPATKDGKPVPVRLLMHIQYSK